jgi:hypothetical protein
MNAEADPIQPRTSSRWGWIGGLALLAVSTAACLLALEVAVRYCFPFFSPKTQIPFRLNEDGVALGPAGQSVRQATPKGDYDTVVHFNALGLRDRKDLRSAKETDWFAVGDSFTLGWGVDEDQRYSDRLEQLFQTNGIPAVVYNVAIPENLVGYGRLLKYAQSRGGTVRHLIVGVCMENDLQNYTDARGDWERAQGKDWQRAVPRKELVRMWLRHHSALYTAVSFSFQRSAFVRHALEKVGIARNVSELSGSTSTDEQVVLTSRDRIRQLVAGYDALVVLIPSRRLWYGASTEQERQVHARLAALLREAGVTVVDLKTAFERNGKPLDYYFATDPHWNVQGHALAAQELYQAIRAKQQSSSTAQPAAAILARPKQLP